MCSKWQLWREWVVATRTVVAMLGSGREGRILKGGREGRILKGGRKDIEGRKEGRILKGGRKEGY